MPGQASFCNCTASDWSLQSPLYSTCTLVSASRKPEGRLLVFQIRECLQLLSRPYLVTLQHKTDAVYGHSEAQQTGKDMQSSLGIFKVNPKRLTTALYVRLKGIIQILTYMTSSSGLHHPS